MAGIDWRRFRVEWQLLQEQVTNGKTLMKNSRATNTRSGRVWVRSIEIGNLMRIKTIADDELDICLAHARDVLGLSFAEIGSRSPIDDEEYWKDRYNAAVSRLEQDRGQMVGSASLLRREWELKRKFAMEQARSEELSATTRRGKLRVVRSDKDRS